MTLSDILPKLLLAVLAGGLIGYEREYRGKTAGLRTIIFISLGATVFTILSFEFGRTADSARVAVRDWFRYTRGPEYPSARERQGQCACNGICRRLAVSVGSSVTRPGAAGANRAAVGRAGVCG